MSEIVDRHRKQLSVMRGWLEGRQYYVAAEALEVVKQAEEGVRKDGVTPKFHHQLSVARLVTTLTPHLIYPEETIACALLHDHLENNPDWTREMVESRFGKRISDGVWTLSKKTGGLTKSYEMYFDEIAACPISCIVKPADRSHNLQTMQGVFTFDKQREYVGEVDKWFYPLIRKARRSFPKQYGALENLKILLRCQCSLIFHIHAANAALLDIKP